jgi:hypothetical protein
MISNYQKEMAARTDGVSPDQEEDSEREAGKTPQTKMHTCITLQSFVG